MKLKYGCNPHQKDASCESADAQNNPLVPLNGEPGYINMMDALTAWQLVKEVKQATNLTCAASFKHVNPAGVAVSLPSEEKEGLSAVANAYKKARNCDPLASFGDAIAVSDKVDVDLAKILKGEVTDLIIAPDFDPEALEILKKKKDGKYAILKMDPNHELDLQDRRELFGFVFKQERNTYFPRPEDYTDDLMQAFQDPSLADLMAYNICIANITLKYTLSNSIAVATGGQVIGISAGQQSRVGSTRLACDKADKWVFSQSPAVKGLSFKEGTKRFEINNVVDILYRWPKASQEERDVAANFLNSEPTDELYKLCAEYRHANQDMCLSSDGFIPFRDNIDRAKASGIQCVVHPGGGRNDEHIAQVATDLNMKVVTTGMRLFYH